EAMRELVARVMEDVAAEGRPVIGVTVKVRYKPFLTKVFTRKIPQTDDAGAVLTRALELTGKFEPERPIRLLGFRAEMTMPEESREGHTPTRSGW
ncbi:MAG TPA: DNA polymerase IV, partial [Naasia sp.]